VSPKSKKEEIETKAMEKMIEPRDNTRESEDEDALKLPGFRFHPTDEELVGYYLSKKVLLKKTSKIDEIVSQIDIYKFDPWDLPSKFVLLTLAFFCFLHSKPCKHK